MKQKKLAGQVVFEQDNLGLDLKLILLNIVVIWSLILEFVDLVAVLINIKWGTKTFKAIQIMDKYGNSVRSEVILELEGCS